MGGVELQKFAHHQTQEEVIPLTVQPVLLTPTPVGPFSDSGNAVEDRFSAHPGGRMAKKLRVLIIEDDLYAQEAMSHILNCDWRTEVVDRAFSKEISAERIRQAAADLILVGGDGDDKLISPSSMLELDRKSTRLNSVT